MYQKAQDEALKLKETMELAPNIFDKNNSNIGFTFYMDLFSNDLVPLNTKDIKEIEYIWLK